MPRPLHGCVVWAPRVWDGVPFARLIAQMGGTICEYPTTKCTHIVTTTTRTRRFQHARQNFSHVPIVHPRWLWACYWMQVRAPVEPFLTDFYTSLQRTGTFAFYGSREHFFKELPLYHDVEDHIGVHGNTLAVMMSFPDYDLNNSNWGYLSRKLQHTTFWGPKVREFNWKRRRKLILPLRTRCSDNARRVGKIRRYMRKCHDGAAFAMFIVQALPSALQRAVIEYC